jgi:hypothetical protein
MRVATESEAIALIDRHLSEVCDTALKKFCAEMLRHGATTDEINAGLARYVPELENWRQDARAMLERTISDPWAQSHGVH